MFPFRLQAEKECSEFSFQLESLSERLDEAEGLSGAQVRTTHILLPTGSEERGVLGVGSIPVAILPSCQDIKTITLPG